MTSVSRDRRRGLFFMDTVIGLVIAGTLGLILVIAITRATQARDRLEDSATAGRAAERALATIQRGEPAPVAVGDAKVTVKPVTGGARVEGREWLEVIATYNGRSASLVGLVPRRGGGQ